MKNISRRKFTKVTGTFSAGMAFANLARGEGTKVQSEKLNILFIMTDQQSSHMMSCTGNTWLKTPAMDKLAASGIRFERAYAANPVCVPSRFSLQTGLMPSSIGMGRNEDSKQSKVSTSMIQQSLGNLFRNAGYETVYGGKLHLPEKMNDVEKIGYRLLTNDSREHLADECARFIKRKHDRPFFLFASFINPHDICYMAINDYRRKQGQRIHDNIDSKTCEKVLSRALKSNDISEFIKNHCPPLPDNHGIPDKEPECITRKYTEARPFRQYIREKWTEEQWRLHRWLYCRLTEMVDAKIGKLLNALEEAGLEDNTLVVLTSDHGDMDASHKMEHKSVLYEQAVRIPFIMSHKGVIPQNKVDKTHLLSNGLDLLPTLCDYAGIGQPEGLSGLSIKPLALMDPGSGWRDHLVVESQNGRLVCTDRFKYSIYDSGAFNRQLVDIKNDPGEMKNLAEDEDYVRIADDHHQLLKKWIINNGDSTGSKYI